MHTLTRCICRNTEYELKLAPYAVADAQISIGLKETVVRKLEHGYEVDENKLNKIDGFVG